MNDILKIDFAENMECGSMSIFNFMGQKVWEQKVSIGQKTQNIDVSDFKNGIYYFKTILGKKNEVHKIVVQH